MCSIMTTLFNRIINSLYAFFPWNQNPHKRLRDDSSDENEENVNNIDATPPKRPKLHKAPFCQKILKEMNPPTVTTVKAAFKNKNPAVGKLQITEDFYLPRRKIASTASSPQNWGVICLSDNGRPPKHVSSPLKLRKRLTTSTPIASIDLTKNDNCKPSEEKQVISCVDLTRPELQGRLRSPARRLRAVVDLTGSGTNEMSANTRHLANAFNGKSNGYELLRRKSNDQITRHTDKPILSIDLTSKNDKPPVRKKRASAEPSNSKPVTVIDLEERNCYGRVLGSMLEGKFPTTPQPLKSPTIKPGTFVDLTGDDDDAKETEKKSASLHSDNDASVRFVTVSPAVEVKKDSSKTSTPTENGNKLEVHKVNSFEAKLKDVPYTHHEWILNLMKEYNETQKSFVETRDRFYRDATAWSAENKKIIEEALEKKLERHLKITEALITETPEELYAPIILPLPPLTKAIESKIKAALVRSPENEVLIDKFNLKITRRDIHTLNGLNWLNDEVINFYMQLLEDRVRQKENYPSIHTFSTFFYAGLQARGHAGMKRWTKKVNIFEKELIIIPIHLHMHWCLVVIDLKKKELNYYDSMGHDNNDCLKHMSNYLTAEHQVKQGSVLDMTDWKVQNIKNIPQQMNGSDCGIFACTYAEFSSRRAPFNFDQSKMQYFRRKMIYEIVSGQLM